MGRAIWVIRREYRQAASAQRAEKASIVMSTFKSMRLRSRLKTNPVDSSCGHGIRFERYCGLRALRRAQSHFGISGRVNLPRLDGMKAMPPGLPSPVIIGVLKPVVKSVCPTKPKVPASFWKAV